MKSILVLTPIYPSPDLPYDTPVVHFFTREWVKMGYEVYVVHYLVNFPKIIHLFTRPFHNYLESKYASVVRHFQAVGKEYDYENVHVIRIPLLKYAPHTRYSQKEIKKAYDKTIVYCRKKNFNPDVIISHWVNPQYEIMNMLKKFFDVPTCFVCHDGGSDLLSIYKNEAVSFIDNTDVFGYRSEYIKRIFETNFCIKKPSFMCYSGVPQKIVEGDLENIHDFSVVKDFIFVGTLIKRKYPAEIIPALKKSFGEDAFSMTYVGSGAEERNINKNKALLSDGQSVIQTGKLSREAVVQRLDASQVFIMISCSETFGLVYLEAMARGCITIASYKEGFDGIIKHGVNGFLCEAGDIEALANVISEIRQKSSSQLKKISYNAIQTARKLTDSNVAKYYIDHVMQVCK